MPWVPAESDQMDPFLQDLIVKHMSMAKSIASQVYRQAPYAMELDELLSIAYMGLVNAATRWPMYCEDNGFDPQRVEYFTPFAQRRMSGAIYDSLRRTDWATRSQRTKAKLLDAAGQGRGATEEELSERTGLTKADIRATATGMARRPVSIDAEEIDYPDIRATEQMAREAAMLKVMADCVRTLPEPQQAVLALHYFLNLELQEVAVALRITESRASHLHTEAVLAVHAALVASIEEPASLDRDSAVP